MVKKKLVPLVIFMLTIVLVVVAYIAYTEWKMASSEVWINSLIVTGDCDNEAANQARITPKAAETKVLDALELKRDGLSQSMVFEIGERSYAGEYEETEIESLGSLVRHKYRIQGEDEARYLFVNGKGDIISFTFCDSNGDIYPSEAWNSKSEIKVMFETKGGWNDLGELTFDEEELRKILESEFSSVIDFSRYNQFTVDYQNWGKVGVVWWEERDGILYDGGVSMWIRLFDFNLPEGNPDLRRNEWFSVKPIICSFEVETPFENETAFERGNAKNYKRCWMPNKEQRSELMYAEILEWSSQEGCPFEKVYKPMESSGIVRNKRLTVTTYENRVCLKVSFNGDGISKVNGDGEEYTERSDSHRFYAEISFYLVIML